MHTLLAFGGPCRKNLTLVRMPRASKIQSRSWNLVHGCSPLAFGYWLDSRCPMLGSRLKNLRRFELPIDPLPMTRLAAQLSIFPTATLCFVILENVGTGHFLGSTELFVDEHKRRLRQILDAVIGTLLCTVAAWAVSA